MTTWRLFLPYILPHWRRLALALLAGVGSSLTDVLRPWPLKIIVDTVTGAKHHRQFVDGLLIGALGHDVTRVLLGAAALIVVATALGGLFDFAQSYWMGAAGQRIIFALRTALYGHIQRLSLGFHDARQTGDLLARVTNDIEAMQDMVTIGLLSLLSNGLTLAGMVAIMALLDWQFAALALSVTPVLFYVIYRYTRSIKLASRLARNKEGQLTAVAQETFAAVRLVQAFGREEYEDRRFRQQNEASLSASLQSNTLQAQFTPLVELVVALGTALIAFAGAERVLHGQLTPGGLLVFLSYLGLMYGPMRQLSKLTSLTGKATASAERVSEIMRTRPEVTDGPQEVAAASMRGHVAFQGVHFSYACATPVLDGIDLDVRSGQTVALVGPTGAGKSTLVSLLQRFYDPQQGRILLDGIDLRSLTLASLRACISIVPQESVLFQTTIRENIAYGRPDATMEEIVAAARAANAHEFIMWQAQGYETVIGERGETLSGGQRQRIAIARAMVRNAPILILDEPTASLDAETEALTLEALERLRRGRTTFIIAHRLSTVRTADTIVVLERGRIIEQGAHDELVARGGYYHRLLKLQFGFIEPEDVFVPLPAWTPPEAEASWQEPDHEWSEWSAVAFRA
jgi:subfamily B ATP-binding cassette protein MsbA